MIASDAATARRALVLFRLMMGLVWFAPGALPRLAGFRGSPDGQRDFWIRTFASRDVALGTLLATASPEHRPTVLSAGVSVDAVDAVAGIVGIVRKDLRPVPGAVSIVGSLLAAGLGLVAIRDRAGAATCGATSGPESGTPAGQRSRPNGRCVRGGESLPRVLRDERTWL